jgi:hypothetical protein
MGTCAAPEEGILAQPSVQLAHQSWSGSEALHQMRAVFRSVMMGGPKVDHPGDVAFLMEIEEAQPRILVAPIREQSPTRWRGDPSPTIL